jgi:hypothetical protein
MRAMVASIRLRRTYCAIVALLTLASSAGTAGAGLGDRVSLNGQGVAAVANTSAYTEIEQTDAASGATIDRFVANGTDQVFAISWTGPHRPDLSNLLSSHFDTYSNAPRPPNAHSLHVVHIDTGSLVVDMSAYASEFKGAAWAPALVPAGVDIDTLLP